MLTKITGRSIDALNETTKKLMTAAQVMGLNSQHAEDKIDESNKKIQLILNVKNVLPEIWEGKEI